MNQNPPKNALTLRMIEFLKEIQRAACFSQPLSFIFSQIKSREICCFFHRFSPPSSGGGRGGGGGPDPLGHIQFAVCTFNSPLTRQTGEREERRGGGGERGRERLRANLSTATDRPTATAQPATTHPVRNGRAIREKGCQTWRFLEPPSPAAQFQFLLYFAPFRASKKPMAFWG